MKTFLISILLLPFAAYAEDDDSCDASLDAVDLAIDTAIFIESSNPKRAGNADTNRSNLLAKLADARVKLAEHKYGDASTKLTDISDKATAWEEAQKQKLEDASGINYAVVDASICIWGLATSAE